MPRRASNLLGWWDFRAVLGDSKNVFERFNPFLDDLCQNLKENCQTSKIAITEEET